MQMLLFLPMLYAKLDSSCCNLVYLASRIEPTCFLRWSFTLPDCSALLDLICACDLQGWSHILSAVADPILGLLDMQLLSLEQPKYDDAHARLTMTDYGDDSAPDSDSDNDSNSVDIASFYSLPQVNSE